MIRYAPYIDGTIPAFTADGGIKVPFQPNLAVGEGVAAGIVLMIKDLNGNILEYKESTKVENNIANFEITDNNFEIGQYYKVQLAYKDKDITAENYLKLTYSSIGITKYIGNANINIKSVDSKKLQYNYECLDSTELLYSLQTSVYKGKFKKIEKEDTILQLNDVSPHPHTVKIKVASKNIANQNELVNTSGDINRNNACIINENGNFYIEKSSDQSHFSNYVNISIAANTTFTISLNMVSYDLYKDDGSNNPFMGIHTIFTDGTGEYTASNRISTTGRITLKTLTYDKEIVKIRVYIVPEPKVGSYVEFNDFQIELGSVASNYTPYIPVESGIGSLYYEGVNSYLTNGEGFENSGFYIVSYCKWNDSGEMYLEFEDGNYIGVTTSHLDTIPEELPVGTQLYYNADLDSLYYVAKGLVGSTITISDGTDLSTIYTIDDTLTIEVTSISPIMNIFSEFTQGILLSTEFLQGEVTQVFQFISSLGKENTLNFPSQLLNGNGYLIELLGTTINNYTLPINQILYYRENNTKNLTAISNIQKNYEYGEIILPLLDDSTLKYIRVNSIYDKNYSFVSSLDNTVEHGKNYYYGVINNNGDWLLNTTDSITPYFEDMFLQDATHSLRIKFNPKVSSFKKTIQESKVDTLGSQYPYFFRNGDMNYAEFPISGLLSYWMGDNGKFGYDWEYGIDDNGNLTAEDRIISGRTTNLVNYNIVAERKYKMKVLEWLNNGQPKLFRSPTEGNFVVRLMNVSLSPEERLGRMLHSFNCTAYECAAADYETLVSLCLVPGSEAEK